MPRNGTGVYTLPEPPFVPDTIISSAAVNTDLLDIAAALTDSLASDGQSLMTGPMQFVDGSASAPSMTFTSSPGTGFFKLASGEIGVAVGGVLIGFFNASGFNLASGVVSSLAIGQMVDFAGSAVPPGWQLCGGQAINRVTFSALFAVIGTTYGIGDGSTTFNVPDCRGRNTFGQDNMGGTPANRITVAGGNFDGTQLGNSGGLQNHSMSLGELGSHTHIANVVDPNHTHTISGTVTNNVNNQGASGGLPSAIGSATLSNHTTGISVNNSSVGGGNPYTILNPSLILNKMIFAGA